MAFSLDNRQLVSGASSAHGSQWIKDAIRLWDFSSGRQLARFNIEDEHDDYIQCVLFSADGQYVFCTEAQGLIRRWRLPEELRPPASEKK